MFEGVEGYLVVYSGRLYWSVFSRRIYPSLKHFCSIGWHATNLLVSLFVMRPLQRFRTVGTKMRIQSQNLTDFQVQSRTFTNTWVSDAHLPVFSHLYLYFQKCQKSLSNISYPKAKPEVIRPAQCEVLREWNAKQKGFLHWCYLLKYGLEL